MVSGAVQPSCERRQVDCIPDRRDLRCWWLHPSAGPHMAHHPTFTLSEELTLYDPMVSVRSFRASDAEGAPCLLLFPRVDRFHEKRQRWFEADVRAMPRVEHPCYLGPRASHHGAQHWLRLDPFEGQPIADRLLAGPSPALAAAVGAQLCSVASAFVAAGEPFPDVETHTLLVSPADRVALLPTFRVAKHAEYPSYTHMPELGFSDGDDEEGLVFHLGTVVMNLACLDRRAWLGLFVGRRGRWDRTDAEWPTDIALLETPVVQATGPRGQRPGLRELEMTLARLATELG